MAKKDKSNELHLTRIFNAPVTAVWEAWTDPDQVAQWWGPRGFSLTTHSKDLKTGGHWSYTMHGPDGVDYPNKTQYLEVKKHSKLVYDHGGNDDRPPLFRVTVTFAEIGEQTKMDMTMTLPTPEAAEQTRIFIKKAGGDSTWDRLGEYLEKHGSGKDVFIINRSFDAPIERIFDMWTDPVHFSKWLPPTGFDMTFRHADIRPGGSNFFSMSNDDGMTMYGRIEYRVIERPKLIVYTQQFCDEHGNISRHPGVPTWPETNLTTVELFAEDSDRTRVLVTWEPLKPTREELETFLNERRGMTQGWTGSFDKLDAYLKDTVK